MAPSTDRIELPVPPASECWSAATALGYVRSRLTTLSADAQQRRNQCQRPAGAWTGELAYVTGRMDGLSHALAVLDAAMASMAPEVRS